MGKFGNHDVSDYWEHATRTLTDISAEEILDLPEIDSNYPCVALQSAGTADAFGAWVELSADVGVGKRLIGAIARQNAGSPTYYWTEFEIGEGAEGSESAITRFIQSDQWLATFGGVQACYAPLWRALTDNARLSVRVRDGTAATGTYVAGVQIA